MGLPNSYNFVHGFFYFPHCRVCFGDLFRVLSYLSTFSIQYIFQIKWIYQKFLRSRIFQIIRKLQNFGNYSGNINNKHNLKHVFNLIPIYLIFYIMKHMQWINIFIVVGAASQWWSNERMLVYFMHWRAFCHH